MTEKHPYISRLESKSGYGWQVRKPATAKNFNGTGMFFNDSKYGGKDKSLAAAIIARDKVFSSEEVVSHPVSKSKHSKNKSGVIGLTWVHVCRNYRKGAWCAYWNEGGKQRKKNFSVVVHGFVEAWELAFNLRMEKTDVKPSLEDAEKAKSIRDEIFRKFLDRNSIAN